MNIVLVILLTLLTLSVIYFFSIKNIENYSNFNKVKDKKIKEYFNKTYSLKSILGRMAYDTLNGNMPSIFS